MEDVFQWHARPGAIERLSPPWDPLQVISRTGGIEEGAEVVLRMKAGPFPYRWHARHTAFEENRLFEDMQVDGPFSEWIHSHRFSPDGNRACFLEDRISCKLPLHPLSTIAARGLLRNKLERIFTYRHRTTAEDIRLHRSYRMERPMTIVVSGASGVVGSALVPFLTTGGHRVVRLVRRPPQADSDEIFWDPAAGVLETGGIEKIDAVVHLAGENIGEGWWTEAKKKRIVESRTVGTSLLAEAAARLSPPPRVFVSASAIGYYGNRGDDVMTEESCAGDDFISGVCTGWEASAEPSIRKGIRTVMMRIGIALSPAGGALARLLPSFRYGAGAKIASGSQYMSWIAIDDVIGAIYHTLMTETVEGAVNVVAPEPLTNGAFTKILSETLNRPRLFTIPDAVIRAMFGEMGREILLSSTRVKPEKLLATGYRFQYPDLSGALHHLLGLGAIPAEITFSS